MLASLADLQARFTITDTDRAEVYLAEADAIVKAVTGQTIELVEGDTATLDSYGRRRLQLPQLPVVDVTAVAVDGRSLLAGEYTWDTAGGLWRPGRWPTGGRIVTVTYSHGYEDVPAELVGVVCRIAYRMLRSGDPAPSGAVKAKSVADYSVTYDTTATDGLRFDEAELLARFMLPVAP
ncbi:MAG TPA: hypothetical protein VGB14_00335 [Acidimicrobiales bacterium]|jgi:hypothetical protein